MAHVELDGRRFEIETGESVLDCLERHGEVVEYSCRSGICQRCLMKAVGGAPAPEAAVSALGPAEQTKGYFLSCVCKPADNLVVERIDLSKLTTPATVISIRLLAPRVVELLVQPESPVEFYSGQFFNLGIPGGAVRSYSAALPPADDGSIAFHIGLMPGGQFSTWAHECAQPGDQLTLQGALGKCCYVPSSALSHAPLLLAGTGTGLAPLYGIALDALANGHPGPIWLFHGALEEPGLYMQKDLTTLARRHEALQYRGCVLRGDAAEDIHVGNMQDYIFDLLPKLDGFEVYLCGHPDFVKPMQRRSFLAGASLKAIHSDPFVPSKAPAPASN